MQCHWTMRHVLPSCRARFTVTLHLFILVGPCRTLDRFSGTTGTVVTHSTGIVARCGRLLTRGTEVVRVTWTGNIGITGAGAVVATRAIYAEADISGSEGVRHCTRWAWGGYRCTYPTVMTLRAHRSWWVRLRIPSRAVESRWTKSFWRIQAILLTVASSVTLHRGRWSRRAVCSWYTATSCVVSIVAETVHGISGIVTVCWLSLEGAQCTVPAMATIPSGGSQTIRYKWHKTFHVIWFCHHSCTSSSTLNA